MHALHAYENSTLWRNACSLVAAVLEGCRCVRGCCRTQQVKGPSVLWLGSYGYGRVFLGGARFPDVLRLEGLRHARVFVEGVRFLMFVWLEGCRYVRG